MEGIKRVATTPERLREALRDSNKKQIDLSRETGLSHSTISRYMSGHVEPRSDAAHKIATALDVSEMWLWGYDVPKERTPEQKKNDDLARIVVEIRRRPELFEMVLKLSKLPDAEFASIDQLVTALVDKHS